jgi:hypothetical protein
MREIRKILENLWTIQLENGKTHGKMRAKS